MPEYSDYLEGLTSAGALDGSEIVGVSKTGNARKTTTQDIADLGGGSVSLTDGNGTTANGSAVDLGGILTQNTVIDGAFDLTIGSAGSKIDSLEYNGTGNAWIFPDGSAQVVAGDEVLIQSGAAGDDSCTIRCFNSAGGVLLRSLGTVKVQMDGTNPPGMQYIADYSSDYTDRSLPDVGYVLSKTTGLRDLSRVSVSVSAGTLTLDMDSKQERKFENTTAISSNFTIAFSNATNAEIFTLIILITGTVAINMPSTVVMEKDDSRFVNGTKILTLIGGTAEPFELSFNKMNGLFICRSSFANYAS